MEDDPINLEGPPGETVFYRMLRIAVTDQDTILSLNNEAQRHLERMGALRDDRALALVGGITVESAVFTFLAELLPGHKELERMSFANQIQVARATRLCPTRLFDMADAVRVIRNKFAHDLQIESLSALQGPPLAALDRLRRHAAAMNVLRLCSTPSTNREHFHNAVLWLLIALRLYSAHVRLLNAFLRSDKLIPALTEFAEPHTP